MWLNESIVVAGAFAIFVPLVYKPVRNLILGFIDKYAAEAVKNLEESRQMRDEAEKLLKEIRKHHAEAQKSSKDIIESSRQDVEEIMQEMKDEVAAMTKIKIDLSVSKIAQQEKQIMESLKNDAISMAMESVYSTLLNELDKSAQMSLIDSNVKNIKKLLN